MKFGIISTFLLYSLTANKSRLVFAVISGNNKINTSIYAHNITDVRNITQKIFDIANAYGYEIIAIETDKDHIHFLLSYDTTDKVFDIVKIVKQETTYYLWHKYGSLLSKQYWKKKIFWSDGYFACSIGEVSSATIQKYIENQG